MKLIDDWTKGAKMITGTFAAVVAIYASVTWFQPRADALHQHQEIVAAVAQASYQNNLESELERVNLGIKYYNGLSERRSLTRDEQDEYEYLKDRRRQIRARLYAPEQT